MSRATRILWAIESSRHEFLMAPILVGLLAVYWARGLLIGRWD